ncbi:uncharacterized protein LOC119991505 [Tripterygium wilfordii]|uniref:uncharacterized protein LOC119991505 n=1 Tax=Tripterygium wilfordii TaxID=458696 RepID=UPI0018F85B43|nr:uncharacterized protein LOC119991505 [Tripterygium wilfordii]
MEGHLYVDRLYATENDILVDMSKNSVKPQNILYTLKNRDPNNVSTLKTIYIALQKFKNAEKAVLLEILRAFPHVLLMDVTYKTNRFRMPLFEIMGVTSTKMTFCIAFVFSQSEKKDSYTWALNCLSRAAKFFPEAKKLLCRWHIKRVVVGNCKKLFRYKQSWDAFYSIWHTLLESENENAYVYNLYNHEIILQSYSTIMNYLKDFQELRGFVSIDALNLIWVEFERSKVLGEDIYSCGCKLRTSYGLPCAHKLAMYMNEGHPIPLACIDKFWKKLDLLSCVSLEDDDIDCNVKLQMFQEQFKHKSRPGKVSLLRKLREIINPSITTLLDPVVKTNTYGHTLTKKKVSTSTRANLSTFEFVWGHLNHSQESDIKADGNCGFQAIARLLGIGKDAWISVWQNLIDELRALWCNVILHLLSSEQCLTFLPLYDCAAAWATPYMEQLTTYIQCSSSIFPPETIVL